MADLQDLAHFARTGWDSFRALLAPLAIKVFLSNTQNVKYHKELRLSVVRRSVILNQSVTKVGHLQGTLVGHPKLVMLKNPQKWFDLIKNYSIFVKNCFILIYNLNRRFIRIAKSSSEFEWSFN